ncbi:MAG: helix-turn-helix domain-containing protein, partial [Alphaproteobacteria bacterium]
MATDNRDEILGKKVAYFRGRMNWPLKTLAGDLGVSIQQLQRYEKGINKISATMIFELAKIFKVDLACFFEETESVLPSDPDVFSILLVEDNVNDEFLLRKALSDFPKKLNIYTINDGFAATNFLNDINSGLEHDLPKPDLIFLDLHLPLMRGLDILKDTKRKA